MDTVGRDLPQSHGDEDADRATEMSASSTSTKLLARAREGDRSALEELVGRLLPTLRRWGHRRLPQWARRAMDTADLVQEALLNTVRHLSHFEPRRRRALEAYLRQAIQNRIRDELRRVGRNPLPGALDPDWPDGSPTPLDLARENETADRYKRALERLRPEEREMIVARIELEYSYEQVALSTGRPTAEAARKAVQRALVRLAEEMERG
jgi:RNA polymerase sigma-70 factor, ECF subfamily